MAEQKPSPAQAADEISDEDLNQLFCDLALDIPDPPPEPSVRLCGFPTKLITELGASYTICHPTGYTCTSVDILCDSFEHTWWRASVGKDVVSLERCSQHADRVAGVCHICCQQ